MDFDDFRRRVRRDDYKRHQYWFVGAAAGILAAILLESPYALSLTGVSLIGSGLAAIRGGKSAVTGIGVSGSGGAAAVEWSTRELEDMSPAQRADHANMTGAFLILMGAGVLAMIAFLAWRQVGEHRAVVEYQAMAEAAGLISRDVPPGTGLSAGSREVCWTVTQSTAACSDSGSSRSRGRGVIQWCATWR